MNSEMNDDWRKRIPNKFLKVVGDFNGDKEKDEARLLVNNQDKSIALFIKYRMDGENRFFLLEIGDSLLIHSMGIQLVKPGKYLTACGKGYWDCGEDEPPEILLSCDAVDLFIVEGANSFIFWDSVDNKFRRIWISD
ncbi:MAG TPA: hypothetical protein PK595_05615 [Bacteroidota bacterium]|nr:hypothetical protein [Bacteroidota bacterium]